MQTIMAIGRSTTPTFLAVNYLRRWALAVSFCCEDDSDWLNSDHLIQHNND